jgi:hypothetical protein
MLEKLITQKMATAAGEAMANAAHAAVAGRAGSVLEQLEIDAAENDGIGEVDVAVKFKAYAPGDGSVEITGLGIRWTRKVAKEDKDFEDIRIDPRQLDLPGLDGGK